MPAGNPATAAAPAVDLEAEATIRIDCYVRPAIPAAVSRTVTDVVDRLSRLSETERLDDYRVTHWPPECHATDPTAAETDRTRTRDELVTEFERWAARQGHSLEPAFRRHEVPTSPFDSGDEPSRERVRVPVIALAVRETDGSGSESDTGRDGDENALRGVVPYTEETRSGAERTYTVDEWLSIVDPTDRNRPVGSSNHDRTRRLEGRQ